MDTLKDVKIGETVRVESLKGEGSLSQHFLDMGIIPGTEVTLRKICTNGRSDGAYVAWIRAYAPS